MGSSDDTARSLRRHIEEAHELLRMDERRLPDAVAKTMQFLVERGIWFRLSRNSEAGSCRDAARKRSRLGHTGIPLRDEMKSLFGKAAGDGQRLPRFVMAHCRGDCELDLEALAAAIDAQSVERLPPAELTNFGLAYGLVNPFEQCQPYALDGRLIQAPILQVFDSDLLTPLGTPGTVMTNAGDLTWGVELYAEELFEGLLRQRGEKLAALSAGIAAPPPIAAARPPHLHGRRSIAIITGNAPESGIALWAAINEDVRSLLGSENAGDASMPPMRIVSLPELGMTMELDLRTDAVWSTLERNIRELCATDVALLAIACNTTQYFADRVRAICEPAGITYVSLPEVVAAWLAHRKVREVAIVGIPYVSDFAAGWSAYAAPLHEFDVEQLGGDTFRRLIELAYRVKEEGATPSGLNQLRAILNQGVRSSHVVLALTELSALLALQRRQSRSGKAIVDPVTLYAEAIARRWLGFTFPPPSGEWLVQMTGFSHHGGRASTENPGCGRNEDALLLGDRIIAMGMTSPMEAPPFVHQEIRELRVDQRDGPVVVAVADGVGSNAAPAQASRFILTRLRDASGSLHDPDHLAAVLEDAAGALALEASRAGDPDGALRGATAAGLTLTLAEASDANLAAAWFSVGDCLLLIVDQDGSEPRLRLLCRPAVGPDGHPQRALGANAVGLPDTGFVAVRSTAVILCCTDGFALSFGAPSNARRIAEMLSSDQSLAPIWRRIVASPGDPDADRQIVADLFAAARSAWSKSRGRSLVPDNLSLALVRIERGNSLHEGVGQADDSVGDRQV